MYEVVRTAGSGIKQHRDEKRENCLFAKHLKCQVFTNTTSYKCRSQTRRTRGRGKRENKRVGSLAQNEFQRDAKLLRSPGTPLEDFSKTCRTNSVVIKLVCIEY